MGGQAAADGLRAFVEGLPKAELHVHLEGCLDGASAGAIASRNGSRPPFPNAAAMRAVYAPGDLDAFLSAFGAASSVLRSRADFHRVADDYLRDASAEGVLHVEMMVDPQSHLARGVELADVLDGIADAMRRAPRLHGCSAGLIVSFMRERDDREALEILRQLELWLDVVVAVGIDSAEVGHPPAKFVEVFRAAASLGLGRVAHAGFAGPVEDIREAVDLLEVDRIDHGTHLYDDPGLAARLASAGTAVTVCPRSEVALGAVPSLAALPLARMVHDGLRCSVGSDDPAWFGSPTDNLLDAAQAGRLDRSGLAELARNSFTTSFLPAPAIERKLALVDTDASTAGPGRVEATRGDDRP